MHRLWRIIYPEYRYFDDDRDLRRRVEFVMLEKSFGAKRQILKRVLFFGLPCFAMFVVASRYVRANPVLHADADRWILTGLCVIVCALFVYFDRHAARRNLRHALTLCGVPVCIDCGYDLASSDPTRPCPECGSPYPQLGSAVDRRNVDGTSEP
jgi:hypothetical protein